MNGSSDQGKSDQRNIDTLLGEFVNDLQKSIKKYNFKNEDTFNAFKESLMFFKSTYGVLIEGFCHIINQIPSDYFTGVGGFFIKCLYLEWQTMRNEIKGKSELLLNEFEELDHKIQAMFVNYDMKEQSDLSCNQTYIKQIYNYQEQDCDLNKHLAPQSTELQRQQQNNVTSNVNVENEVNDLPTQTLEKTAITEKCYSSEVLIETLNSKFGLKTFGQNQWEVINAALSGHDCFVQMPNVGEKSLCYQLPALLTEGVTIVISPSNSLITYQINKLTSLNIVAKYLSRTDLQENAIYDDLRSLTPRTKILYFTPKKLVDSKKIWEALDYLYDKNLISRFVIDEVHYVSMWGHDFRSDYKHLKTLRRRFPQVKIMALTAIATERVRVDIENQLGLRESKLFISQLNRTNLEYRVIPKKKEKETLEHIQNFIKSRYPKESGIIYCLTRKECEEVAKSMKSAGISACTHHTQREWITNKVRVICATIDYDMGIEKHNIRFVIHYTMPASLESYYLQSGRAGRDGELAHCILYYSYDDMKQIQRTIESKRVDDNIIMANKDNLKRMRRYCENDIDCRRSQLLQYFGVDFYGEDCTNNRESICDNCLKQNSYQKIDASEYARKAVNCVKDLCRNNLRYNLFRIAEILKGVNDVHYRTKHFGVLKNLKKTDIERLLRVMVTKGFLREDVIIDSNMPQEYISVGKNVEEIMQQTIKMEFVLKRNERIRNDEPKIHIRPIESMPRNDLIANSSNVAPNGSLLSRELNLDTVELLQQKQQKFHEDCYQDLLKCFQNLASGSKDNVGRLIRAMSIQLPTTENEMMNIVYMSKTLYERYGQSFLQITRKYNRKNRALTLNNSKDEPLSKRKCMSNIDSPVRSFVSDSSDE